MTARSRTIPGDASGDGVGVGGPLEGSGVLVAGVDVVGGRLFRGRDAGEHAAAELLLGDVGEDALEKGQYDPIP